MSIDYKKKCLYNSALIIGILCSVIYLGVPFIGISSTSLFTMYQSYLLQVHCIYVIHGSAYYFIFYSNLSIMLFFIINTFANTYEFQARPKLKKMADKLNKVKVITHTVKLGLEHRFSIRT